MTSIIIDFPGGLNVVIRNRSKLLEDEVAAICMAEAAIERLQELIIEARESLADPMQFGILTTTMQ